MELSAIFIKQEGVKNSFFYLFDLEANNKHDVKRSFEIIKSFHNLLILSANRFKDLKGNRLARNIDVPVFKIQDILHDRRKITIDRSLRLATYFAISEHYFINLQNDIDLRNTKIQMSEEFNRIKPFVSVSKIVS